MSERITYGYIEERVKKTIDQYYAQAKYCNRDYIKKTQIEYIGGILQTALHLLPTDRYYAVKDYVY